MNYKKKKVAIINGIIYNLENWVSLKVEFGTVRKDENGHNIYENLLVINLPKTSDTQSHVLQTNYEGVMNNCLYVHLGLEKQEIESLFLQAECKD